MLEVDAKVRTHAPVHCDLVPLERLQRLLGKGRHHLDAVLVNDQQTESLGEHNLKRSGEHTKRRALAYVHCVLWIGWQSANEPDINHTREWCIAEGLQRSRNHLLVCRLEEILPQEARCLSTLMTVAKKKKRKKTTSAVKS